MIRNDGALRHRVATDPKRDHGDDWFRFLFATMAKLHRSGTGDVFLNNLCADGLDEVARRGQKV